MIKNIAIYFKIIFKKSDEGSVVASVESLWNMISLICQHNNNRYIVKIYLLFDYIIFYFVAVKFAL